ncbi:MAG: 50S ribosome-binding GTPase [Chloroflexi bacterium]|nr:50S ribosome-binding GTPase [Chloroflexota bacterium]
MPMPHRTQMTLIKRRLVGKEGAERVRELRGILSELPNYKNGPYADIRKWVLGEIDATRSRARIVYRDSIAVRREGAAQIALVGPPNAGKSSLLHALSDVQIKIGNYAFTTLRPVPALVRIEGVLVQFVEIPGLLQGASDDHGGGRAYLGVLREADAIVYCQDATAVPDDLRSVMREVARAGIARPALLALTKCDDASSDAIERFSGAFPGLLVVATSILDDASLGRLRAAAWRLTGLIRVHVRDGGDPFALPTGSTVLDLAAAIHSELARDFAGARVWGPSARFAGQRVGRDHVVREGDTVEVLTA